MQLDVIARLRGRVRGPAHEALRRLRGLSDAPVILMYHRVADPPWDPWGLCVAPDRFGDQLAVLRAERTLLSMEALVEGLVARRLPKRATAITFDDGYRDNATVAKPLLEAARAPATMFLTSGFIGSGERFWWDELAALVLGCGETARFALEVSGRPIACEWPVRQRVDPALRHWRAFEPTGDPRARAYFALWSALQRLPAPERDAAMAQLRALLPARAAAPEDDLPMSREEAGALASPWISVGGHGRSHVPLPVLPEDRRGDEIAGGRADIAALTGSAPTGFAYPHGEWDQPTRTSVARAGYGWAVTTRRAVINPAAFDLLTLPRVEVGDWAGARVVRAIKESPA